jgi:ubiquinone/menaquinone biosynthesis C-methylase UbiE
VSNTDASRGQVDTEAARVYDEFFVPALFGQWVERMLDAARVGPGDRVLDVGCGTGALARAASRRVGAAGEVVGLDPNEGMLAVASRTPEPVTWRSGVAEDLPYQSERFDRVLSQFVWMFLDDHRAAAREIARVLVVGGTVAVATWSAIEESPGYASMVELLRAVVGDGAARALLAPFSIGSASELQRLLAPTFPDIRVTRHEGVARFASVEAWLHTDIRGWTLSDMIDDATYLRLLTGAEQALSGYVGSDGEVHFPVAALIATATKRE